MQYEKIKYTILRDRERRPTVTICEVSVNGYIGVGMAIRSQMDNPVEKIGKVKARGRAIKALVRRENSMPICRAEAYEAIYTTDFNPINPVGSHNFKSFYCEEV